MVESKIPTQHLLRILSRHITNRSEFNQTQFQVTITPSGRITMSPTMYVFPNRYHRKDADKVDLLTHVLADHLDPEQVENISELKLAPGYLSGCYQYVSSFSGKRRTWIRLTKSL